MKSKLTRRWYQCMYKGLRVHAVIPARNEAASIGTVIDALRAQATLDRIVVCDNGSSDTTAAIAAKHGAVVVEEPCAGYGAACQRALAAIDACDIVIFIDADRSVDENDIPPLLDLIVAGADLAVGIRPAALRERGAMTLAQRLGNHLVTSLINRIWKQQLTDLGPLRAIRSERLLQLQLRDRRYGWNVEMQLRSIQQGLRQAELPVRCLRRVGRSKIGGNPRGIVLAGYDMLTTLLRLACTSPPRRLQAENQDTTLATTDSSP